MGISGYAALASALAAGYSAESQADSSRKQEHAAAQAAQDAKLNAPQAAQAPNLNQIQQLLAGKGQAGGQPGASSTVLTGPGVDPGTLNLGKSTLLGA